MFRKVHTNSAELNVILSNLSTLAAELCIPFEITMQYHLVSMVVKSIIVYNYNVILFHCYSFNLSMINDIYS